MGSSKGSGAEKKIAARVVTFVSRRFSLALAEPFHHSSAGMPGISLTPGYERGERGRQTMVPFDAAIELTLKICSEAIEDPCLSVEIRRVISM